MTVVKSSGLYTPQKFGYTPMIYCQHRDFRASPRAAELTKLFASNEEANRDCKSLQGQNEWERYSLKTTEFSTAGLEFKGFSGWTAIQASSSAFVAIADPVAAGSADSTVIPNALLRQSCQLGSCDGHAGIGISESFSMTIIWRKTDELP